MYIHIYAFCFSLFYHTGQEVKFLGFSVGQNPQLFIFVPGCNVRPTFI